MGFKEGKGPSYQNREYHKELARKRLIILGLIMANIIASFWAINAGAMKMGPKEVILSILGIGNIKSISIVRNIRMPRVISGILAGWGLSLAGCIMQNNLKNPLASPSTLGISNAAAFGANVAIILLGAGTVASIGVGEVQISNPFKGGFL